jgi:hypothetical protein
VEGIWQASGVAATSQWASKLIRNPETESLNRIYKINGVNSERGIHVIRQNSVNFV